MARTGPQKIPGAVLDLFFGDGRYSGSDMEVNCGVIHTTESPSLYDYNGGGVAPTVTAVPDFTRRCLVWHQHFDVDESARALVNAPGGVQTNLANTFQIELVGTCDPSTHADWTRQGVQHIYWPEPPDWAVRDLSWLMRWLRDQHGIPLTSGLTFKAYPDSYGATNGVRLSFDAWTGFTGWCGHQHVPENLHGDPGALPISRLLALAAGTTTTVQEDDMPSAQDVAEAVWGYRLPDPDTPGRAVAAGDIQAYSDHRHTVLYARVVASQGAIAALADLVAKGGGLTAAQVQQAVDASIERFMAGASVQVTVNSTAPKGN